MSGSESPPHPGTRIPLPPDTTSRPSSPTGSIGGDTLTEAPGNLGPSSPVESVGGATLTEASDTHPNPSSTESTSRFTLAEALVNLVGSSGPSTRYTSPGFGTPRIASTPITRTISRDELFPPCSENLQNTSVRIPPTRANLTSLFDRLEAATSRLEDLVPSADGAESPVDGSIDNTQTSGLRSISGSSVQSPAAPSGSSQEQMLPSVSDFNSLIKTQVKVFVEQSQQIGSHVADQAKALLEAFQAEERHLRVSLKAKKPDIQSSSYVQILKEIQSGMSAVSDLREANRASPLFNHLSAVSEGSAILGWVAVEPKPVDFIKESFDSARFYGNRVIQEYKEKEPAHVEWVKSLYRINDSLMAFVKKHYEGGLTWNANGIDPVYALEEVQSGKSSNTVPKTPSTAGGPPPPPPLPKFDNPPAPPMPPNGAPSSSSNDMGAVFDQISRGSAVTSGLKKVDPSQMTHKNPSLRTSSTVPTNGSLSRNSSSSSLNRPNKKPKPESMRTKKPPRKDLDGNKWIVENYDNSPDLVEIEVQTKHSILISRCAKTTIRIKGKANAISVDNSPNLNIIIDSLVSSIDVIKCASFAVQVTGVLPTIMLDQVDGAQIYLGKDSLETQILQSKCSGLNVLLPGDSEEEDFREMAAPEQIRSFVSGGKLVSEIVEHAG